MYRDEIIDYLVKSGFVENYCKKLVYPSDKESLQDDFIQECWLQVLEISEDKWIEIIDSNKNKDRFYGVRNFVSVVIRNTVVSTTSSAYRKLKKQNTVAKQLNDNEWKFLANTISDNQTMF
jgi:hypothetical protein